MEYARQVLCLGTDGLVNMYAGKYQIETVHTHCPFSVIAIVVSY